MLQLHLRVPNRGSRSFGLGGSVADSLLRPKPMACGFKSVLTSGSGFGPFFSAWGMLRYSGPSSPEKRGFEARVPFQRPSCFVRLHVPKRGLMSSRRSQKEEDTFTRQDHKCSAQAVQAAPLLKAALQRAPKHERTLGSRRPTVLEFRHAPNNTQSRRPSLGY